MRALCRALASISIAALAAGCGNTSHTGGGTPGGSAELSGHVTDANGTPLGGVMMTAFDDAAFKSTTVFSDGTGRYSFPPLPATATRLRARQIGYQDGVQTGIDRSVKPVKPVDFALGPTADLNAQLPSSYFYSLLEWPSAHVKGDFTRACGNCHPIGFYGFHEGHSEDEWKAIVDRMIARGGVPFFNETRPLLLPTLVGAFGPNAPTPHFVAPPPPTGDAARAVITEWEIDPQDKPGCHDLELGTDGTVYMVPGIYTLNPDTGERNKYLIEDGGHSVERAPDGAMWITAPGPETLVRFDPETKQMVSYKHPRIGDDLGSYPHTLRFDAHGVIWETLTRSNHVASFDPATAQFTYHRLPPADPKDSGTPIAVAYGLDVAPDQSVWWSQLFGQRIGVVDPATGAVRSWRPPFDGPRRLAVGPDGIVWVPAYGASKLGRFDPKTEQWTVYELPTLPRGSDLPYTVNVNRHTGDVWITGGNSDTLIRFRPSTEEWTIYPLPTPVDFTREIEFGDDDSVWTCTSDAEIVPDQPGTGRLIHLQLLDRVGRCGDGTIDLGEECDDGNTNECDGCSAACRRETGCGDGAVCGGEECDDGNTKSCDGCSSTCQIEQGSRCGDGIVSSECDEQCDPPGDRCTVECTRIPTCGDGVVDPGEQCDDGNNVGCDGCSSTCKLGSTCGDGDVCGDEQCDDGNTNDCDGCSSTCKVEPGAMCGDGMVDAACGEQCDPPGGGCSLDCRKGDGTLGVRHFSFGGSLYSSALGADVPLGPLSGALDISAGAPNADGIAQVQVQGPIIFTAALLGGTYGTYCVQLDGCSGTLDCNGGSPAGVITVQDSAGAGLQGLPPQITLGQGDAAGPGALVMQCSQSFVQLLANQGSDCTTASYPPAQTVVYTTGRADAYFTNANPKIGNATLSLTGENFSCASWPHEDSAGALVGMFLVEEDPQAGDVANGNRLDD